MAAAAAKPAAAQGSTHPSTSKTCPAACTPNPSQRCFADPLCTTAVARLHEYVRSELAAAPNVHTAVLVLE